MGFQLEGIRKENKSFTTLRPESNRPVTKFLCNGIRPLGRSAAGFTLLELIVVSIVIGILVTAAIPQYQRLLKRSKWAQAEMIIDTIYKAVKYYRLAHGTWPENQPWDANETDCNDINAYLIANDMGLMELSEKGCRDFDYNLYYGGVNTCASDTPECSILANKKEQDSAHWGMRKRLYTGVLETNPDPVDYP